MADTFASSGAEKFFTWLFQTKPLIYPNKKKAVVCFIFLCVFSLVTQAIRWSIPSLQVAGMQCSSCGEIDSPTFESCQEQCLDLTDPQMGALSGPAFTLTMTLATIPIGLLADRMSRVRLILMLSLAWSIGALSISVAEGFWELLVTCALIGCSVAVVTPCAFSLLADYFPPRHRSLVISIFSSIIFLGYDAGLGTAILGQYLTWRWAYALLGIPGFIFFIPALFMREPTRGLSDQNEDYAFQPLTDSFGYDEDDESISHNNSITIMDSIKGTLTSVPFLLLWMSATLRLLGGFALGGWMPTFYRRVFNLEPWEIAIYLSIVLTIGGLSGSFTGGFLADKWSTKSKAGKVWLVLISTVVSIPFMIGMLLIPNAWASLGCLLVGSFFGEMWFGPSAAAVQDIIEPNLRSFATSIYLLGIGVGGVSALFVGYLNQWIGIDLSNTPGVVSYDPTYSMLIVIVLAYSACAVGYGITGFIFLKKKDNPFMTSGDDSLTLDDTIWSGDFD